MNLPKRLSREEKFLIERAKDKILRACTEIAAKRKKPSAITPDDVQRHLRSAGKRQESSKRQ